MKNFIEVTVTSGTETGVSIININNISRIVISNKVCVIYLRDTVENRFTVAQTYNEVIERIEKAVNE